MNKKSLVKIITFVLTIFNLCATIYYIKSSKNSTNKLRKIQSKLNNIKDDLSNITEELEDLTDELNESKENITKKEDSFIEKDINVDNIADIDTIETINEDEE